MQSKLDHIVKTTLARPALKEVGTEELLMLTHEFPYTAVLQFLYSKRLQQSQDPRFGDSVTRTALFFNNPHWLNQQLRETTAAERVREQVESSVSVPESAQTFVALDTIEHEGSPDHVLSTSEQALIDSLTEAPDGSLIQHESEMLAAETRENESVTEHSGDWETETAEPEDSDLTDAIQSVTDISTEAIESPAPDFDGSPADVVQAKDEMITADDHNITFETATTESMLPSAEIPEALQVAEEISEYAASFKEEETKDDPTALSPSDMVAFESEAFPNGISSDQVEHLLSPGDESIEVEAHSGTKPYETDALESEPVTVHQTSTPAVDPQPLITVIASVEAADVRPIHTISITKDFDQVVVESDPVNHPVKEWGPTSEEVTSDAQLQPASSLDENAADTETDNDDDASIMVNLPQEAWPPVSPAPTIDTEQQVTEPSQEMVEELESDNDDDSSVLIDQDPVHMPEIPDEATKDVCEEEFQSSGIEHLGFQPEELLEASDATDDEPEDEGSAVLSTVEAEEGWETSDSGPEYNAEDDDHPDATDPGDMPDEDTHSPVINPGDLIRMAGLDMHTETELSFEPLHLTDYFASVGVSLHHDAQPDVFSRQSRSFTGWIRSMKRIHPEKIAVPFTQTESEQIRNVAEQSNEQEEVLTETMAGIYALQGLTHKAIDIYEKLSLLNPEKSAIFAAKLSELKGKLP